MRSSPLRGKALRCRGFTLLELLVCVAVIAVVAAFVVPVLGDQTSARLSAAAAILESDIEFTQALNIADPARPMVLRIDADRNAWWIAPADDRDRPLRRPDGTYYVTVPGHFRAASAAGVTLAVDGPEEILDIRFSPTGGLADSAETPAITLNAGAMSLVLQVHPHTGRISLVR